PCLLRVVGRHCRIDCGLERPLPDGTAHWVAVTCVPLFDRRQLTGFVATVRDITERRRRDMLMRDSEAGIALVLECLTDRMFRLNRAGHFTFFNRALRDWLQKLGKKPIQLIGTRFHESLPDC